MKVLLNMLSVLVVLALVACDDDAEDPTGPDWENDPNDLLAPTVQIQAPADNSTPPVGDVLITATASDDTEVRFVRFLIDDKLRAEVNSAPYQYTWDASGQSPLTAHEICAQAFDKTGKNSEDCVSITFAQ